jgi:hypothetical protein
MCRLSRHLPIERIAAREGGRAVTTTKTKTSSMES